MTTIETYLGQVRERIEHLQSPERLAAIGEVADLCAKAIANERIVYTFGTGHGSFAPLEMFPRTGTCVGFRPIPETALTNFSNVFGDMGLSQYRYLHTNEGYGRAILDSYEVLDGDVMILFSHSGINNVIIDIALSAKERGATVVGITSLPHSSQAPARHSSDLRLFEAADLVIDTGVPLNDAAVPVDGLAQPVGPTSTVIASAIAHAIVSGTVERLVARGIDPLVMVNPNTAEVEAADAQNERNLEETRRRFGARAR